MERPWWKPGLGQFISLIIIMLCGGWWLFPSHFNWMNIWISDLLIIGQAVYLVYHYTRQINHDEKNWAEWFCLMGLIAILALVIIVLSFRWLKYSVAIASSLNFIILIILKIPNKNIEFHNAAGG